MYLPIKTQPDCASAWREAVRAVDNAPEHSAYNVIIDVTDPVAGTTRRDPRVAIVEQFLNSHEKSLETVANTLFPSALYHCYGAPKFFDVFRDRVLDKVRRNKRWSGYYFERMIQYPVPQGEPLNQLWDIVERIRDKRVRACNKFELSLFDPIRDVDRSPYGGQCLSFLSFKIVPGSTRTLTLTALYRNHFYIEKLLGNLIGLGRLMAFVAQESNVSIGSLTIVSTHAVIDKPGNTRCEAIKTMLADFDQAAAA